MKARQRASQHSSGIKASSFFCIPYISVHALGRIFKWTHSKKALLVSLKLIKKLGGQQEGQCRRRGTENKGCGWALAALGAWMTHSLCTLEATHLSPVSSSSSPQHEVFFIPHLVFSRHGNLKVLIYPHKLSEMVLDQKNHENQIEVLHFINTHTERCATIWPGIEWTVPQGTDETGWDEREEQLGHQMSVWGSSTFLSQLVRVVH